MGERTHTLEVRVDKKLVEQHVTVDMWLDLEDGKKRPMVEAMAHGVWYDGEQLSYADGRAKIGALPLGEFNVLINEFVKTINELAVPNENGADS